MKQADKENNHINWKLFAQFLSAHKWVCGLMAVLILLASTTVLIPPWVLGRFVDQLYMPGQAWMWGRPGWRREFWQVWQKADRTVSSLSLGRS